MDSTIGRRGALKCMAWAGTGLVWSLAGGIPFSRTLEAATTPSAGLTFVQISDSHIGFSKDANPDVAGTLKIAIDRIRALPTPPAFIIHTGDITHLSKPAEFDMADQILAGARTQFYYVPGEHDVLEGGAKAFLDRYGKGTFGNGWHSFDAGGVHFVGLVNVVDLKPGGLGQLGDDQLEWLEKDLAGRSAETPIVVFAHMPLWSLYPDWGWGTSDAEQAMSYLKRFGSVTVLNGHIHQVQQKVEGNVTFHTAMSTAYPQPEPGKAKGPGPLKVPAGQLQSVLGTREVVFKPNAGPLALTDTPLAKG
jgi:3',5'-cyclic AMP phosphodiesterase CpdA